MRRTIWLLILCSAFGVTALAARQVEVRHEAEPGAAVRVDCRYGRVRIVGSAAGEVRVTGEVSDHLEGVSLRPEAGALELRVSYPVTARLRQLWQDEPLYAVDLLVEVPVDTRLFLVSRDAEVTIEGIEGPVGVGTVSSRVSILGSPSRVDVETITGDLSFDGSTPSLRASTMSGRLEARGVTGRARLEAVSGSLALLDSVVSGAEMSTVSGAIRFAGEVASSGELRVESESGDVTLACCGTGGAALDLLSRDGEISNELTEAAPVRDARGHRRLSFALGEAGGLVEVRTRSGLVRLLPAEASGG